MLLYQRHLSFKNYLFLNSQKLGIFLVLSMSDTNNIAKNSDNDGTSNQNVDGSSNNDINISDIKTEEQIDTRINELNKINMKFSHELQASLLYKHKSNFIDNEWNKHKNDKPKVGLNYDGYNIDNDLHTKIKKIDEKKIKKIFKKCKTMLKEGNDMYQHPFCVKHIKLDPKLKQINALINDITKSKFYHSQLKFDIIDQEIIILFEESKYKCECEYFMNGIIPCSHIAVLLLWLQNPKYIIKKKIKNKLTKHLKS